jgi:hypothetical protein
MKPPRNTEEPRRAESGARVTLAEAEPSPQGPAMRLAEIPVVVADAIPEDVVEFRSEGELVGAVVNLAMDGYIPIASAPQDGTMIELKTQDGTIQMAIWRRTSRYDAAKSRWVPVGFWSNPMNREPLKIEAVEWRMPAGFAMPGAVVA